MSEAPIVTGFRIPTSEKNDPVWAVAGPKPIFHYLYKMRQTTDENRAEHNLPKHALVLFKDEQTPDTLEGKRALKAEADSLADMQKFAKAIVSNGPSTARRKASSVHITVDRQCWLVIELAADINWRFSRTHTAVTTKHPQPIAEEGGGVLNFNADLHYVFEDGTVTDDPDGGPPDKDCRLIYFRVLRRTAEQFQKGESGMNFFVEFYQTRKNGVSERLIPIIIDPDVPDQPNQFPPP